MLTILDQHRIITTGQSTAEDGIRVKFDLTHEEIGQMIGVSRVAVSRLFPNFREKQVLQLEDSTLVVKDIKNISTLQKMAEGS
jgi:CRP-like cAMP-binding protein